MPYAQEIIFVVSMIVICGMLVFVTRDLDHASRMTILYAAIIIFAFRATPSVGDGYFWWTLDVLKFDEAFYGILRQTGAILSIVAHVAVRETAHAIFRRQDAVLDRGRGHHPVAAERRAVSTACTNGPKRISASAPAPSPSSTPPPPRRSRSSA